MENNKEDGAAGSDFNPKMPPGSNGGTGRLSTGFGGNIDWLAAQSQKLNMTKFLSDLDEINSNLVEAAVEVREKQGFPEANMVIKHIMEKK